MENARLISRDFPNAKPPFDAAFVTFHEEINIFKGDRVYEFAEGFIGMEFKEEKNSSEMFENYKPSKVDAAMFWSKSVPRSVFLFSG